MANENQRNYHLRYVLKMDCATPALDQLCASPQTHAHEKERLQYLNMVSSKLEEIMLHHSETTLESRSRSLRVLTNTPNTSKLLAHTK